MKMWNRQILLEVKSYHVNHVFWSPVQLKGAGLALPVLLNALLSHPLGFVSILPYFPTLLEGGSSIHPHHRTTMQCLKLQTGRSYLFAVRQNWGWTPCWRYSCMYTAISSVSSGRGRKTVLLSGPKKQGKDALSIKSWQSRTEVWDISAKQMLYIKQYSVFETLSSPFQSWNTFCGHCHLITTSERGGSRNETWQVEIR